MFNINEIKQYTQNLSILFVEDHQDLRESTTDILKSFFKEVTACENGQEALDVYSQYKEDTSQYYDIVLSDIQMPLMNGIELTKNIYIHNPLQTIIIISAFDDTKYLLELINLGIDQFIPKPINAEDLFKSFLQVSKKIENKNIHKPDENIILFAEGITYNLNTKSVNNSGENVYLTKFEIIFIELLISSFGKIYSNEDIVTHYMSCGESINPSNIRKLVSKLRKKIPKDSLESIYGIGYKFISL